VSPAVRKGIVALTSMKVAVACFLMLALLTFLGTIHQVDYGLHDAEEKYFGSWGLLHEIPVTVGEKGYVLKIPLPGAATVLTVLFVNMSSAMILLCCLPVGKGFHLARRVGVLLTHGGVLVLILGGAWIEWTEVEANLTLVEGEQGNLARMYGDWELAFWKESGNVEGYRNVIRVREDAIEAAFENGKPITVPEVGVEVTLQMWHPNAKYDMLARDAEPEGYRTVSHLAKLTGIKKETQHELNQPGGMFLFSKGGEKTLPTLLFGLERNATDLGLGDDWKVKVQRQGVELPLKIELLDFIKEDYDNTAGMARAFSSEIRLHTPGGGSREMTIRMNKPLRYKGWTVYQKSFEQPPNGPEVSSFAVVYNRGQYLPYYGTGITGVGLVVYYLLQLVDFSRRSRLAREGGQA